MTRPHRPNLPGLPFHLTARVQWRQPLFVGLEAALRRTIEAEAATHRAKLIAWAVMSNHLHIVAVQGPEPPGRFMGALLRKAALIVNKRHGREGHVFERRYYARPCLDPVYLRTALGYVHLNPVRAGICASPDEYPWTSHAQFSLRGKEMASVARLEGIAASTLRLFAGNPTDDLTACALGYHALLDWMQTADNMGGPHDAERAAALLAPTFPAGDAHWIREFSPAAAGLPGAGNVLPPRRPAIRQLALAVLAERAPDLDLDTLRGGGRTRPLVQIRRDVMRRCADAGYRTGQIARYLRVSPTAVSVAVRTGAPSSNR